MVWWPLGLGVIAAAWELARHPDRVRPALAGLGAAACAWALVAFVTRVLGTGWPWLASAGNDPRVVAGISAWVLLGAFLDGRRPRVAADAATSA